MADVLDELIEGKAGSWEGLAESIHKVAGAIEEAREAGISERLLVLLIHDLTKIPLRQIQKVLGALAKLPEEYLETEDETDD